MSACPRCKPANRNLPDLRHAPGCTAEVRCEARLTASSISPLFPKGGAASAAVNDPKNCPYCDKLGRAGCQYHGKGS